MKDRKLRAKVGTTTCGPRGKHVVALGIRIGYWPCLRAPFIMLTFGIYRLDVWHGLEAYW